VELAPGPVGEIVSMGPQVFEGYWHREEANAECFIVGRVSSSYAGHFEPLVPGVSRPRERDPCLAYSPAREEYALGPGVLVLGHTYLAAMKVREVARPLMQALADLVQATVVHDALHMVVVEVCHGSPSYKLRIEVGERVPRHLTALGRANLAATPPRTAPARTPVPHSPNCARRPPA
jgi:acyl-CoA synthetase (AMP-forming)/AMP-acid ligase II